jgi:aldehyde dehydrogenase (NAD+)
MEDLKRLNFASEKQIDQVFEEHQKQKIVLRRSTVKDRKVLLKSIKKYLQNELIIDQLKEAVHKDFNKPYTETELTEVVPTLAHLNEVLSKLKSWVEPKRHHIPLVQLGLSAKTIHEPKGASLIISPWNYPFYLAIYPLIYAIAAGCTVVLKPSEMTPHTSAFLEKLFKACLPEKQYKVLQGSIPETTHLLSKKWDHIFFTGSPAVGKIVMKAASNHLTSVSLELGGKSPCIIDETAPIKSTAEKLAWGKFINAGQTCIAPDYVLVHESKQSEMISELKEVIKEMYGENPNESDSLARIINEKNTGRVGAYIENAVSKGAKIEIGGKYNRPNRYVEPTVLTGVHTEMDVMKEEIFGPVLPVITYKTKEEALSIVNSLDKPLAFYLCTKSKSTEKYYRERTTAGGMVVNEFILGAALPSVPFGGVNNSGIGKAYGFHGFIEFTNEKPVVKRKFMTIKFLYPPYNKSKVKLLNWLKKFV